MVVMVLSVDWVLGLGWVLDFGFSSIPCACERGVWDWGSFGCNCWVTGCFLYAERGVRRYTRTLQRYFTAFLHSYLTSVSSFHS